MSIHFLCLIGTEFTSLIDDGFCTGLDFAAGFPGAFSSSWIGMAYVTNLSILFTIGIQDSVWSLNKDWTGTSTLCFPLWLQTFMSETGPNRTLLWIHPFILVPWWSRGNVYSRHKDWFPSPLGDGRAQKNCPISTNLNTVWITSGLLTIFQIVAGVLVAGFPVTLHWLAILREDVV